MQKIFNRLFTWLQLPDAICDPRDQMSLRDLADLPSRRLSSSRGTAGPGPACPSLGAGEQCPG